MSKSPRGKKASQEDWHRAEILCALRLKGWTIASLSRHHEYASRTTLGHALHRPWPKAETLIAAAIGVPPETIWPSRYQGDSTARSNARSRREHVQPLERVPA